MPSPANAARRDDPSAKLGKGGTPPTFAQADSFRWLVEEFRVSLFAQELGTAEPVSAVKLDRALAAVQAGKTAPRGDETPAPPPTAVLPLAAPKKTTPLKNLGALDKLFPR